MLMMDNDQMLLICDLLNFTIFVPDTAITKNDCTWYTFDDCKIHPCEESDIVVRSALYIIFNFGITSLATFFFMICL